MYYGFRDTYGFNIVATLKGIFTYVRNIIDNIVISHTGRYDNIPIIEVAVIIEVYISYFNLVFTYDIEIKIIRREVICK